MHFLLIDEFKLGRFRIDKFAQALCHLLHGIGLVCFLYLLVKHGYVVLDVGGNLHFAVLDKALKLIGLLFGLNLLFDIHL